MMHNPYNKVYIITIPLPPVQFEKNIRSLYLSVKLFYLVTYSNQFENDSYKQPVKLRYDFKHNIFFLFMNLIKMYYEQCHQDISGTAHQTLLYVGM